MKLKHIKEKRYISSSDANARALTDEKDNQRYIEGYAALFEHESRVLYDFKGEQLVEFIEIIEQGAFDDVLADANLNCIHTINHNRDQMVARTKSGTLQLSVDDRGLKYRFSVPNTTLGNDLYEMVKRGDMFESSFVFTVDEADESWEGDKEPFKRSIKRISGLYDTSCVTDAAYSATAIVARSIENVIKKAERATEEQTEIVTDTVIDESKTNDSDILDIDIFLLENDN